MVENRKINPWKWQDAFGFSQAIETTRHTRVLRCAGQASTNASGESMHAVISPHRSRSQWTISRLC